jgi:hypothetical protein
MIRRETADSLITSRLLILQSKRLMLKLATRRFERSSDEEMLRRVERLRGEIENAQHRYRSTILAFESPDRHEYWLVAYGRLIDMGGALINRLRDAASDLPADERYAASTEVEMLESIMEGWTESMRTSMAAAGVVA